MNSEPDKQGHAYGPDAKETYDVVSSFLLMIIFFFCFIQLISLDNDLDYLLTKVKNELNDDLNIIILSDHVFNKQNI